MGNVDNALNPDPMEDEYRVLKRKRRTLELQIEKRLANVDSAKDKLIDMVLECSRQGGN